MNGGVVTVADSTYLPGVRMLQRYVRESHPVPPVCFDIALTDEQRDRELHMPKPRRVVTERYAGDIEGFGYGF